MALLAGCGGIAVIDEPSGGGGSGGSGATSSSSGGGVPIDACARCDGAVPEAVGTLAEPAIAEASGIAASARHDGVLYLHNDSGDGATFYAIDATGKDLGRYDVLGADAVDWEDMAVAPCTGGSCLYIGDIGDNAEARTYYTIFHVLEPDNVAPGTHQVSSTFTLFAYPDGSHDAEALFVVAGNLFIVTKVSSGPAGLYMIPTDPAPGMIEAARIGEVVVPGALPQVTAGDAGPFGILLRTYASLFLFPLTGTTPPEVLTAPPCLVPVAIEAQGEAVAWLGGQLSYVTVSEGVGSALNHVRCP